MRSHYLVLPIVFVASLSSLARAEWASDWATGCKVALPSKPTHDDVSWNGACKNGLATGQGTLRGTNATRIEGEFHEGRPITATGRYLVVRGGGQRELVQVSYREGVATILPSNDKPGRKRIDIAPLVGSWDWRGQDGGCKQTREYLATGESIVREGSLGSSSQFVELYSVDGMPGWMEMASVTIGRVGVRDCSNKAYLRDGDIERMYLRIDQGSLSGCTAPDEKSCLLSAVRSGSPTGAEPAHSTRQLITSQAGRSSGSIDTENMARGFGGGAGALAAADTKPKPDQQNELVFDRNKGALYALYSRALRDHPTLSGKIAFEIDIDAEGAVTDCRVRSSELNAPGLESRLCTRIRMIRFGARDAPVTLVKHVDFFPA